ncbi:unnamed protein product, partial [Brachionus calyciflorus]
KIGATFDEDIVQNYILKVLVPDRLKKDLQNTKLFLDSARCHMTVKVKSTLSENYIDPVFIPPRLTNLLQPADVSWFASFKKEYNAKWNKWFIEEERTYTKYGNPKSPGYSRCIQWLSEIWHEFSSDQIIKSFSSCGIMDQFNLHSALSCMLKSNTIITDYIDEIDDSDDIDSFETNDNNLFEHETNTLSSVSPQASYSPSPQTQPESSVSPQASYSPSP